MKLTVKQEKFCIEYLKDGNASRAYREAYSTANFTEKSINESASKILRKVKVTARFKEIQEELSSPQIKSIAERKKFLCDVIDSFEIDQQGNKRYTDALKALDLLNKMEAVYVQKQEISGELNTNVVYLPPKKT